MRQASNPSSEEKQGQAESEYVGGTEAAAILGIKPQTLYTYVSRGALQSLPTPHGRRHLYLRADIEKLRSRPRARLSVAAAAASAMYAGDPIIPTSITEITVAGPCYRGRLASELATAGVAFENVAEFLWTGELLEEEAVLWTHEPLAPQVNRLAAALRGSYPAAPLAHVFSLFALSIGMARGPRSNRLRTSSTALAARQVIQAFAGCFGYVSTRHAYRACRAGESIAVAILRASEIACTDEKIRLVNALLVMLADHELSPATFAARIAASSGADLQACLVAAIETSSGRRISEVYDRTEEFLRAAGSKAQLMRRARELQARGRVPPGFNQPIYPRGDPRAPYIFELIGSVVRRSRELDKIVAFLEDAEHELEIKPRAEFAVVAVAQALGFPPRAAAGLYVIARVAGWVAHIMEQRMSSALLRPRAKFVS